MRLSENTGVARTYDPLIRNVPEYTEQIKNKNNLIIDNIVKLFD